jgi:hypothetical protein
LREVFAAKTLGPATGIQRGGAQDHVGIHESRHQESGGTGEALASSGEQVNAALQIAWAKA